ncbi:MAG: transglutaminase family protein [Verrucomicrobiota bacterium]
MRYCVTHISNYHYAEAVSTSHHALRLTPRQLPHQTCRHASIAIMPLPAVMTGRTDYFGNHLTFVAIQDPHKHLVVHVTSEVEVSAVPAIDPARTPAWETVRDTVVAARDPDALRAFEFTFDSSHVRSSLSLAGYAAPCFSTGRPVLAAVLDLTARIHQDFIFDPRATTVATPLERVFEQRRGVCQDFAHLQIACLRSLGLPARYVSGYLQTVPPPNAPRLIGADVSHAWVSVFCPGVGWIDVDPTNNCLVTTNHITLAWGRDYANVSPIRGVIVGGGEHNLQVSVDVAPVG